MTEQLNETSVETTPEVKTKGAGRPKKGTTPEVAVVEFKTETKADIQSGEVQSITGTSTSGVISEAKETKSIGIYALVDSVVDPTYGTQHSACFDVRVNLDGAYDHENNFGVVKGMIPSNQPLDVKIEKDQEGRLFFTMRPHSRVLAPTAMILDIPVGYAVKVHPRSGTSFKEGINLINQEGVIDADYVEELFLPLVNTSDNYVRIYSGERYAQAELQVVEQVEFTRLTERPLHKTDRTGGFGSTGVK